MDPDRGKFVLYINILFSESDQSPFKISGFLTKNVFSYFCEISCINLFHVGDVHDSLETCGAKRCLEQYMQYLCTICHHVAKPNQGRVQYQMGDW